MLGLHKSLGLDAAVYDSYRRVELARSTMFSKPLKSICAGFVDVPSIGSNNMIENRSKGYVLLSARLSSSNFMTNLL